MPFVMTVMCPESTPINKTMDPEWWSTCGGGAAWLAWRPEHFVHAIQDKGEKGCFCEAQWFSSGLLQSEQRDWR